MMWQFRFVKDKRQRILSSRYSALTVSNKFSGDHPLFFSFYLKKWVNREEIRSLAKLPDHIPTRAVLVLPCKENSAEHFSLYERGKTCPKSFKAFKSYLNRNPQLRNYEITLFNEVFGNAIIAKWHSL